MQKSKRMSRQLFAVFLLFFLLLNYPLINLFNKAEFIGYIPQLYLYVFLVWLGLIITTAFIVQSRKSGKNRHGHDDH
jgi:hypothetical protein